MPSISDLTKTFNPVVQKPGVPAAGPSVLGFVKNLLGNVKDIASIPKSIWDYSQQQAQENPYFLPDGSIDSGSGPRIVGNTMKMAAQGTLQNLADTAGISADESGVKVSPQAALQHAYDRPVDTAMTVLPLVKGAKDIISPKAIAAAEGGQLPPIQGRMATNALGAAVPESVTKSEGFASKALNSTKSMTKRGIARELESSVGEIGKKIESTAQKIDQQIGPQPFDAAFDYIMKKVDLSDIGVTGENPKILQKVRSEVTNLIQGKDADFSMPVGQMQEGPLATTVNQLNEARKSLNKKIPDSWFRNGMPEGTPTNDLRALRWQASQAIKEYVGQVKGAEDIASLIDQQHTALTMGPVVARDALTSLGKVPIQNIPGQIMSSLSEPITIGAARLADNPVVNAAGKVGQNVKNFLPAIEKIVQGNGNNSAYNPQGKAGSSNPQNNTPDHISSNNIIGQNNGLSSPSNNLMFTDIQPDASGKYSLSPSGAPSNTFITEQQFRQQTAGLTPGTPEYQRLEDAYSRSQQMAKSQSTPAVTEFMKIAPVIQKNANQVLDNVASGTYPMGVLNRFSTLEEAAKYIDPEYQGFVSSLNGLNNGFKSLYGSTLGQEPTPDLLVSPKDSPEQAQAKIRYMTNFFAGMYSQFKDAYAATTSPSGTLSREGSPQGLPPIVAPPEDDWSKMGQAPIPQLSLPSIR